MDGCFQMIHDRVFSGTEGGATSLTEEVLDTILGHDGRNRPKRGYPGQ